MANDIINQLSQLNNPLTTGNLNNIPTVFALYNNHPNPFNPITVINFDIPENSLTKITIYDVIGRETIVLVNQMMNPGSYIVTWDASNFASGIYFYRMEAGAFIDTKKMVLLK